MKKWVAFILAVILLCSTCVFASAEITTYTKCGTHGTAKRLAGRTAVVSIFAYDSTWDWDETNKDAGTVETIHHRLGVALNWIEEQAASYGVKCEFIWDWKNYNCGDLVYRKYYDHSIESGGDLHVIGNGTLTDVIDSLDNDAIMRNHNAENILYIFYFNTPNEKAGGVGYASPSFGELEYYVGDYEYVVLPIGKNYPPGTYAHEVLHLYGAPDLYGANKDLNTTDKFIKAFKKRYPRELFTGDPSYDYDHVDYVLSPLSAYYVGLTNYSSDQQENNLRKSEYDLFGY